MSRNSVLIIPALNPDVKLVSYVKTLVCSGFSKILIIDDGSSGSADVFAAIQRMPECELLVHTVNMGKGRALKDAFNYYLQKYSKDYMGVITADSDGQHTVEDVIQLDSALMDSPETLILGVRDFEDPSVPFKSRFGNKVTKYVLEFFIGSAACSDAKGHTKAITDTQTGLRAIPNQYLPRYLTLNGERFEYETNMLIEVLHTSTPVREVKIQTVYVNENRETHFRPLADSVAIYWQIFSTFLKYTFASLSSFLIDYSIYSLLIFLLGFLALGPRIWIAAASARVVSSLYNYMVNRTVVFREEHGNKKTFVKYYTLCVLQLACSASIVWSVCRYTGISEVPVKVFADLVLFAVSFQVQKNWVFQEQKERKNVTKQRLLEG